MSKIIYCDGSSLGNPGPGGFGVLAIDSEKKLFWEYGGAADIATNNQMELAACVFALKLILKSSGSNFEIRLDSKYVLQGATEWIKNWVKNNWKSSQKKDVLNKDYWQEILELKKEIQLKKTTIKWTHVYGHTGEVWNERVDEIAKSFASKEKIKLEQAKAYK